MLEVVVTEIGRQPIGIEVIQPLDSIIWTTWMETIVVSTTYFVKSGILIGSATNLGYGLGGILTKRKLSRSLGIPITIIGVVATLHMVFTNPIMIMWIILQINHWWVQWLLEGT